MTLRLRAHAKINWALNIVGRREDGYHALDMVTQAIDLCDEMTFAPADAVTLTVDGAPAGDENLVVRAAKALKRFAGTDRGVAMTLRKRVPARAGLGGGSADCALTLRALNEMWALGLTDAQLTALGAKLGADVPFCLAGGLARVTGIGERIAPFPASPRIPLALVTPGGGLSTAEVFGLWDRGGFPPVTLDAPALGDALARGDLDAASRLCANALTAPAVRLMPEIDALLRALRALGASAAFMTGSGSTVVGAFQSPEAARRAADRIPGAIVTFTR